MSRTGQYLKKIGYDMLMRLSSGRKQVIFDTNDLVFSGISHSIQISQIKSLQCEETNLIFFSLFLDFHEFLFSFVDILLKSGELLSI